MKVLVQARVGCYLSGCIFLLTVGLFLFVLLAPEQGHNSFATGPFDMVRSTLRYQKLKEFLIDELYSIDPSISTNLLLPQSPQYQALHQLSREVASLNDDVFTPKILQRFAVFTFFRHFDLPLVGTDECSWISVGCDVDGRLTSLQFPPRTLSGTLPQFLEYLSDLETLVLQEQLLKGAFPKCDLKQLKYLNVSTNQLTSLVPHIRGLTRLEIVHASSNDLRDTIDEDLTDMNPVSVVLSGNPRLSGKILEHTLPVWPMIQEFRIPHTNATGSIPDIPVDSALRFLETLNTRLNSTLPESLANAHMLETIEIGLTGHIYGTLPASYALLSNLRSFRLRDTDVTGTLPKEWGALTNLELLDMQLSSGITGTIPSSWVNLQSLTTVDFGSTKLSGEFPTVFGVIPSLTSLDLSKSKLSGTVPNSYCDPSHEWNKFWADCNDVQKERPQVECSCCTRCVSNAHRSFIP